MFPVAVQAVFNGEYDKCIEEFLFAVKIVEEETLADPRVLNDRVGRGALIPLLAKFGKSGS